MCLMNGKMVPKRSKTRFKAYDASNRNNPNPAPVGRTSEVMGSSYGVLDAVRKSYQAQGHRTWLNLWDLKTWILTIEVEPVLRPKTPRLDV